jgi:phosphoribosylformylglycinamidine synthase
MWQLVEAIEGIAAACSAFEIPITGGNVSLYNETEGRAIFPTPVLGVVGLIDDAARAIDRVFQGPGRDIFLLGRTRFELGGSEYLKALHGEVRGVPPILDLSEERALQRFLVRAISRGLLDSANDCSEGGLAVALAESAFDTGGVGLVADVEGVDSTETLRAIGTLFSESATRAVVSARREQREEVMALAAEFQVPCTIIGTTGGPRISISVNGQLAIDLPIEDAEHEWKTGISRYFSRGTDTQAA